MQLFIIMQVSLLQMLYESYFVLFKSEIQFEKNRKNS